MEGDEASSSPERSSPEEGGEEGITEYEKQRLSRIKENRARLEALGLPHLASSLQSALAKDSKAKRKASKKSKGDRVSELDDEEYRPYDEDDGEGKDDESSSPSEEYEDEEDYGSPRSRQKAKKKNKSAVKVRQSSSLRGNMKEFDLADDDVALQQAIALSLGGAVVSPSAVHGGLSRSSGTNIADSCFRGKKDKSQKSRKGKKSRVQLTEDEVVAYFFAFDVAGKGHITLRDLQRIINAHDFTWTDIEIAHMIHSFDSDGDGKLNLDDFRAIVARCKMIQETEVG